MLKIVLLFLSIQLLSFSMAAERVRYDNHKVFLIIPKTDEQTDVLREMDNADRSLIFLEHIQINNEVHMVLSPEKELEYLQILDESNISYALVQDNLQELLDLEILRPRGRSFGYNWIYYQSLEETYEWLNSLANEYSNFVQLINIGYSYEGRQIRGVKVSYRRGNSAIVLEGGMHAREWIAPATVTYILNELLTSQDPEIKRVVRKYDWYVLPHANPDGYVYTQNVDRIWRKTRSVHGNCSGVDPNRNFDYHWNEVGSDSSACSEIFPGDYAFSEVETLSLAKYLKNIEAKIFMYLAFHAFSQLLLFPYGHVKTHSYNYNDLHAIGEAGVEALARRYGTKFQMGNVYETIYPVSGSSMDWVYGVLGVKLSYSFELRPSHSWKGFMLPAEEIVPSGEETLDGVIAMIDKADELGYS